MEKSLFDKRNLHKAYDKSRALPEHTVEIWMEAICSNVVKETIRTILDIGCGTGHFCTPLAERFSAKVIGVDPSSKMLSTALANTSNRDVAFCCGSAEELPVRDGCVDLVFLSMVYQHFNNKEMAFCKINKALRYDPPGYLCIRNSTRESVDSYEWAQFFPGASRIGRERAETRAGISAFLQKKGFALLTHSVVSQEVAGTYGEYCDKLGKRGYSSLQAIPDAEFESGMKNMKAHFYPRMEAGPVFEDLDFFVFSKR